MYNIFIVKKIFFCLNWYSVVSDGYIAVLLFLYKNSLNKFACILTHICA